MGAISGTHINPAITLGLWSVGKIGARDAVGYVVAQLAGGALAMAVSRSLVERAALTVTDSAPVFASEALGTSVLALGVLAVVLGKAPAPASGITIGGALLVGIAVAFGSNGVLNPAVALGIGSLSVNYVLGPILGSILAMQLYRMLGHEG